MGQTIIQGETQGSHVDSAPIISRPSEARPALVLDHKIEQVLIDTVQSEFIRGRKNQECPRRGYVILTSKGGKRLICRTRCKTYRCVPCAKAVSAAVALKAEIGSYLLGRSYFITVTLAMGTGLQKDAHYVQKAWRAFQAQFRNVYQIKMKYMKVVELTKQKQPHLHMVAGGFPSGMKTRCPGDKNKKAWVTNGCFEANEPCLLHMVAKSWLAATKGQSWVCDVGKVRSGKHAGAYISKYLAKDLGTVNELEKLGFKRRWSATSGFTPDLHLRLRGTELKQWEKVEFWDEPRDRAVNWVAASTDDPLLEMVGHPLVMERYETRRRKQRLNFIKGVWKHANNVETMGTKEYGEQYGSSDSLGTNSPRGESEWAVVGNSRSRRSRQLSKGHGVQYVGSTR